MRWQGWGVHTYPSLFYFMCYVRSESSVFWKQPKKLSVDMMTEISFPFPSGLSAMHRGGWTSICDVWLLNWKGISVRCINKLGSDTKWHEVSMWLLDKLPYEGCKSVLEKPGRCGFGRQWGKDQLEGAPNEQGCESSRSQEWAALWILGQCGAVV